MLIHTLPTSSLRAMADALSTLQLHTDAPRPVSVALTRAKSSSVSVHFKVGKIGPVRDATDQQAFKQ